MFTDFSKAFDHINHLLLLQKLNKAGTHGNLFQWFSSHTFKRSLAVTINDFTSAWLPIFPGIL